MSPSLPSKSLIPVLYIVMALLGGAISAFFFFALSFNGAPWAYMLIQALIIAIFSGFVGRLAPNWRATLGAFFLPHVALIALLIIGSFQKGGWWMNLGLIALVLVATWAPAVATRRLAHAGK